MCPGCARSWTATFDEFYDTYFPAQRRNLSTSDHGMGALADKFIASKGLTGNALLAFK